MFSNKIGLVLTYNNKKISSTTNTPTPIYTTMNRNINRNINTNTMSSIIHQPAGTCSSCGN